MGNTELRSGPRSLVAESGPDLTSAPVSTRSILCDPAICGFMPRFVHYVATIIDLGQFAWRAAGYHKK